MDLLNALHAANGDANDHNVQVSHGLLIQVHQLERSKHKLLQVVNHDRNGGNASVCNFTCTSVCSNIDLSTSFANVNT